MTGCALLHAQHTCRFADHEASDTCWALRHSGWAASLAYCEGRALELADASHHPAGLASPSAIRTAGGREKIAVVVVARKLVIDLAAAVSLCTGAGSGQKNHRACCNLHRVRSTNSKTLTEFLKIGF